jgi:hypothetical protein
VPLERRCWESATEQTGIQKCYQAEGVLERNRGSDVRPPSSSARFLLSTSPSAAFPGEHSPISSRPTASARHAMRRRGWVLGSRGGDKTR